MRLHLDHLIVAVRNLDQAAQDYCDLGFTVPPGGVHANGATQNALIAFEDGTYIELLALTGATPAPGLLDFSILLHGNEGLAGYALRTDDIETDWARLKAAGVSVGEIVQGERRRGDGVRVQWRLMQVDEGFSPFFIQDVTPHELRVPADVASTTHVNRAVGLEGVEIVIRSMKTTAERYRSLLGLSKWPHFFSGERGLELRTGSLFFSEAYPHEAEKIAALDSHSEALFALHVTFDNAFNPRFTPDKTHGVRIAQRTGASR